MFVYSQQAVPQLSNWGKRKLRAGSGEGPCLKATGVQRKGRWLEKGWDAGIEDSWEMQSNLVNARGLTTDMVENTTPFGDPNYLTNPKDSIISECDVATESYRNTVNKHAKQPTHRLVTMHLYWLVLDGLISGADIFSSQRQHELHDCI